MPATALHLAAKAGELDEAVRFVEEEAKGDTTRYVVSQEQQLAGGQSERTMRVVGAHPGLIT